MEREREIGSEFHLIQQLLGEVKTCSDIVVGNGHDAAVFNTHGNLVAVSVDSVVEGRHFSKAYFSPEQIGSRAIEGAASDIIAVGALPRFFLVALLVPSSIPEEWLKRLYAGVLQSIERLGCVLLGGDTNSAVEKLCLAVTAIGTHEPNRLPLRRDGARPGDEIYISGGLGGSAAGLTLLQSATAGFEEVKAMHLTPTCRFDLAQSFSDWASAAIDISDGLSNEIHHICAASKCGAILDLDKLPAKCGVIETADFLGRDPLDFVLHGGEEFEVLAIRRPTCSKPPPTWIRIGTVVEGDEIFIEGVRGGRRRLEPLGFDHFRS